MQCFPIQVLCEWIIITVLLFLKQTHQLVHILRWIKFANVIRFNALRYTTTSIVMEIQNHAAQTICHLRCRTSVR